VRESDTVQKVEKSQNHGIEEWRFACACVALASTVSLSHDATDAHGWTVSFLDYFFGFLWLKFP
jgi:hypothetical protein